MDVYYVLIIFAIAGLGAFWFLYTSIKNLDKKVFRHTAENDASLAELDDSTDKCMEMLSRLSAKVQELDKEMEIARDAIENWSEAGKLARKSEEDFNEGLNNILSYQPNVKQKGEEN